MLFKQATAIRVLDRLYRITVNGGYGALARLTQARVVRRIILDFENGTSRVMGDG